MVVLQIHGAGFEVTDLLDFLEAGISQLCA